MNKWFRARKILSGIIAVCLLVLSFSPVFVIRNPAASTLLLRLQISFAGDVPLTESSSTSLHVFEGIRDIYNEISQALGPGELVTEERRFEYCKPYEDTRRALYRGKDGAVRAYQYEIGSDDSMVKYEFYYDRDGALRFH